VYRDDHEAAICRIDQLERELAAARVRDARAEEHAAELSRQRQRVGALEAELRRLRPARTPRTRRGAVQRWCLGLALSVVTTCAAFLLARLYLIV
jgi:hypothetical protein